MIGRVKDMSFEHMITQALGQTDPQKGMSRTAIMKYILDHFTVKDNKKVKCFLRFVSFLTVQSLDILSKTLKDGLETGIFAKVTGVGLVGSFKLASPVKKKTTARNVKKSGKYARKNNEESSSDESEDEPVLAKKNKKSVKDALSSSQEIRYDIEETVEFDEYDGGEVNDSSKNQTPVKMSRSMT